MTPLWPVLIVRSRLAPEDRARARAAGHDLSARSDEHRIEPSTLQRILWVGVGVLVLAALRCWSRLSAGFPALAGASTGSAPPSGRSSSPVARRAVTIPGAGARRSSGSAASSAGAGSPDLADEASRLAWEESPPVGDAMSGLVGRAEQALKGVR